MHAELNVNTLLLQQLSELRDRVLGLRNRHSVAGSDHDLPGRFQHVRNLFGRDLLVFTVLIPTGSSAFTGSEATQNDGKERAVHRLTHDVGQERTRGTNQSASDDQQVVVQHEPGSRSRPT